jgi:hypothetical protein
MKDFGEMMIVMGMMQVIEQAYKLKQPITWRTVYKTLRLDESLWDGADSIDDEIVINNDAELFLIKATLESKFTTKH